MENNKIIYDGQSYVLKGAFEKEIPDDWEIVDVVRRNHGKFESGLVSIYHDKNNDLCFSTYYDGNFNPNIGKLRKL